MIPEFSEDPRYGAWPFWVLELDPSASVADIEKAARDITAKLQFGMAGIEQFGNGPFFVDRHQFGAQIVTNRMKRDRQTGAEIGAKLLDFGNDTRG